MSEVFDASLPSPYAQGWKQAERPSPDDAPRLSNYQAPGGNAIAFVLEEFKFSGGQSVDTSEYPFFGLWSNEALNEKPQLLRVNGFIRGPGYLQTRNDFIEALRVKTSDDAPGFIDFPFWGRFPVVIAEYEIAEKTNEKGQCALSLAFTRAGVSIAGRAAALPYLNDDSEAAAANLEAAAVESFEKKLAGDFDSVTLAQGFGGVIAEARRALGLIRAAVSALNTVSGKINGLAILISQGAHAPGQAASALLDSIASLAALPGELTAGAERPSYPAPESDNEKKILRYFLLASGFTLDVPALTVRQENTKRALENLYRAAAFGAASRMLAELDDSRQKTQGYWNLYQKLETSIDTSDPALYAAVENARIAASRALSAKDLIAEKKRRFELPLPLLSIACFLGCDEAKLRKLNRRADSFVLQGDILYV
jgi:hypothetical protein